jgi:IS5 family transposase
MRQKRNNILPGFFHDDEDKTLKIVKQFREEYKLLDDLLQKYPELINTAHRDLKNLCKPDPSRHREPDFTTEQLLRGVLVMQIEALTYRETTVRIAESKTLQNFCRLTDKETINHSLLCSAFKALSPETWKTLNQCLAIRMIDEKKIDIDHIRTDTTVVETNIHYPTDSSLLWDTFRTIDRLWSKALDLGLGFILPDFRFHPEKVRKLHLDITRFVNSKDSERKKLVKKNYDVLIERTDEALVKAKQIATRLQASGNELALLIGTTLASYFPAMEKVVDAARRRYNGEKVPVEDKVFSIFESHTDLIQRGHRAPPLEFGHKILIVQTREKFITDYEVYLVNPSDTKLLPEVVESHHTIYQRYPSGVAADKGFHPGAEDFEDLIEEYEGKVEYFGVPGRLRDFGDVLLSTFQRWRAGIEGTISCLKRAFRLSRCHFKGFRSFCSGVGSAIFCHNLRTIVRNEMQLE